MNMITAKTSLVCVIGDPIKHSVSPLIHNAALKEMNLNWCYMAIPCSENNLKLVLSALRVIDCKGINITIPHKSNALNYCVDTSLRAKGIGAVNTLIPYKLDLYFFFYNNYVQDLYKISFDQESYKIYM